VALISRLIQKRRAGGGGGGFLEFKHPKFPLIMRGPEGGLLEMTRKKQRLKSPKKDLVTHLKVYSQ